jgi:uncharacterized membrane protein YdfJ with MMPL/SSD domain
MAGMYLGGAATFMSFATGTILVVALSIVGSLTVLPAVLSKLGDRVNKGRVPFLRPEKRTGEARAWSWVLDRVLRRPLASLLAAGAVLVVLAVPVLHIHTADSGVDGLPRSLEVMQTYDRMQAAFPGEQFTADVVVDGDPGALASIHPRAAVDVSPDRELSVVHVPLPGTGTDDASIEALGDLRERVENEPAVVGVSGFTAGSVDFNDLMQSRIWYVLGFVFLMAFVLLLVTFRSIVIPLKAIALNALSVAAAMGVVTWVFQDGNLEGLLDFQSTGAISSWFPLMLFVILFGLSMDYHVFILSRIKEAFDRGETTDEAVAHGIKSTAGVVSAAALVMVGVFSIFATLSFIDMKQFGVGLAVAVLIDATLVRGVMLPAAMKLLGDRNWYLPSWLEWLPRFEHEAPLPPAPAPSPAPREPRRGPEPQPAEA